MKNRAITILIINLITLAVLALPILAQDSFGDILGAKNPENKGQEKKAIIGNVGNITSGKIFIEDKKKISTTEALIDNKTKVVGQDKKILRLSQIKIKDKIAVIGTDSAQLASDGARLKKALKVYLKPASEATESKRRAIQGVVTDISGSIITLAHQIQRERISTVVFNSMTQVNIKGIAIATVADIKVGDRIVAVGDLTNSGSIVAKRIHVIPGLATGIFKKSPLPTATPIVSLTPTLTATPSASISGTPTPNLSPTLIPSITASPTATPTTEITQSPLP